MNGDDKPGRVTRARLVAEGAATEFIPEGSFPLLGVFTMPDGSILIRVEEGTVSECGPDWLEMVITEVTAALRDTRERVCPPLPH